MNSVFVAFLLFHLGYAEVKEEKCGALPKLDGYVFADGKSVIGAQRKFDCLPGYHLDGMDSVTCTEEIKWSFGGTCLKDLVLNCGPKPKCPKGKTLFDFSGICGEDGTWVAGWKCLSDCVDLPEIENGWVSGKNRNIYGSVRKVSCDKDFHLEGNDRITCGKDGLWSEVPKCIREDVEEEELSVTDLEAFSLDFYTLGNEYSGDGTYEYQPEVYGNISCFPGNKSAPTDQTMQGYFYWPNDRCNGRYECINQADEINCPEKCSGVRYPDIFDDIIDCRADIPMFFFDIRTGNCVSFSWGGCADVANMFGTEGECHRECDSVFASQAEVRLGWSGEGSGVEDDELSVEEEDSKEEVKPLVTFKAARSLSHKGNNFRSLTVIGGDEATMDEEVEKLSRRFPCNYYDPTAGFYYEKDKCNGDYKCNNGRDEANCTNKCYGWPYPLASEFAECRAAIPMFFYDIPSRSCKLFEYGGCGDFINLFRTPEECAQSCRHVGLKN